MSTTATTDLSVDVLNSLLRGEISAQEAHEKALALASDMPDHDAADLRRISAEHTRSAEILRTEIFRLGGVPAGSGGAWGAFARAFQSSANLIGAPAAISSLREGEEHGLREYQDALVGATGVTRAILEERLIPDQREHISALNDIATRRRTS